MNSIRTTQNTPYIVIFGSSLILVVLCGILVSIIESISLIGGLTFAFVVMFTNISDWLMSVEFIAHFSEIPIPRYSDEYDLFQSSLDYLSNITVVIVYILIIVGFIFQIAIITLIISLFLKVILRYQEDFENMLHRILYYPSLGYVVATILMSLTIFSIMLIKTIEDVSWFESIYFAVITITTVGFGDSIATHPISKVATIILIINGVTIIAAVSQILINRLVRIQLTQKYALPTQPLLYSDHIIIAGYGSKGRKLASIFRDRGHKVVIVELDEDRLKLAELNGFEVINGDITKPSLLNLLSLESAAALCLLLSNDNTVLQASILARSISDELSIFSELLQESTYRIARQAGIDKPIFLSQFLTNEIQSFLTLSRIKIIHSIQDLKQVESSLGLVQIPVTDEIENYFPEYLLIGIISVSNNRFYSIYDDEVDSLDPDDLQYLIAVEKEELSKYRKNIAYDSIAVNRIVFTGYGQFVETFIERIGFPSDKIYILWSDQDFSENILKQGYLQQRWTMENGHDLLEKVVQEGDLVICNFVDITASLVVGVAIENIRQTIPGVSLIQLAEYEFDIEALARIGADAVYTPQTIIASAILDIFLEDRFLSLSHIYTNAHVFEHLVLPEDNFEGKTIQSLNRNGVQVLYYSAADSEKFIDPTDKVLLVPGDRILVLIQQ